MQYAPRAAAPRGEAWSNFRLAQALGQRLGLKDAVFHKDEQWVLGELLRGAGGSAAGLDPAAVQAAGPMKKAPQDAQEFRTPSGRLEFYSAALAAEGVAPMPDWQPDTEDEGHAARWPLRLLTAPGYFQPHTTYSGVALLRQREGLPVCILHPADADKRRLKDGQRVRLYNERGATGLVLQVSDEVQPGVAFVPGQRRDEETVAGTINMLCSDRYTDMGEGATYQSTWLDVAAWDA